MSLQAIGLPRLHRIERETGLRILRATVNNSNQWRYWLFTTDDHQHGWFDRTSGAWEIDAALGHTNPMCDYLFGRDGQHPRTRDESWGVICAAGMWHVAGAVIIGA